MADTYLGEVLSQCGLRASAWQARQAEARALLTSKGLPRAVDESYRRTDVLARLEAGGRPRCLQADAHQGLFAATSFLSSLEALLAELAPYRLPLLWEKDALPPHGTPPEGLSVRSFGEIAGGPHAALFERHVFSTPLANEDNYVRLNEAAFREGLFLDLAPGTILRRPVLLHAHAFHTERVNHSYPRAFIHLGAGAQMTLIEAQEGDGHQNGVLEIVCEQGAALTLYKLQNDGARATRLDHTYVELGAGSRFGSLVFSAGRGLLRNNLYVRLSAKEAMANLHGFYLCEGQAHIDNHSTLDHGSAHTHSRQTYKGVLLEKSRAVFNGRIFMRPKAAQATAYQSNKNVLMSTKAKVHTKPQLEIWVDDVRCSHGCTVGQLSGDERFYLQARGMPRAVADELLLMAFANEVLEACREPLLRAHLSAWLGDRFRLLQGAL